MIMDIALYLLPYVLVFGVAYVLGFMSRNGTVDRLGAEVVKLKAELSGVEIRTSCTEPDPEPVRPVQPRTRTPRTLSPAYSPEHSAARTEPIPDFVRYVAAAEGSTIDDPMMTDAEYALRFGRDD
jgi:hypothetical protein